MKNLGIGFWVAIAIAIIVIGILAYLGFRYSKCKNTENTPCGKSKTTTQRTAISGAPLFMPDFLNKGKIKCNFWKGKTCE